MLQSGNGRSRDAGRSGAAVPARSGATPPHLRPKIGVTLMVDVAVKDEHLPRYGMTRTYFSAIRRAGGLPVALVPGDPDEMEIFLTTSPAAGWLDGLCLTGGGDLDPRHFGQSRRVGSEDPDVERDAMELALLRAARLANVPLLAICRGIQVLNAAWGGSLLQDIALERLGSIDHTHRSGRPRDERTHEIEIVAGSRLHAILGGERVMVNSLHHQALDRIAPEFVVTARAPDGIVEAIERPLPPGGMAAELEQGEFLLGVQFHPEDLAESEPMARIFNTFVQAASVRRSMRAARG